MFPVEIDWQNMSYLKVTGEVLWTILASYQFQEHLTEPTLRSVEILPRTKLGRIFGSDTHVTEIYEKD